MKGTLLSYLYLMFKDLIIGECYEMRRITGKILIFRLVAYNEDLKSLSMTELHHNGQMVIDSLSPQEIISIKKYNQTP